VLGGAGDDSLVGAIENDSLSGDDGQDTLVGNDGDDTLLGGTGNDVLLGGPADDSLLGNAGDDALDGAAGNDQLAGGVGGDTLRGGDGGDAMFGNAGDDSLGGQAGNDTANGGPDNDLVSGGADDDSVAGGTGDDLLLGGAGNDILVGNAGDDALDGGAGGDRLIGGQGADIFSIGAGEVDTIADFEHGADRISLDPGALHALLLSAGDALPAGSFVAGVEAADADDFILYDAASGSIYYDQDGNGAAAAQLIVTVAPSTFLSAGDFLVGMPTAAGARDAFGGDAAIEGLRGSVDTLAGGSGDDFYVIGDAVPQPAAVLDMTGNSYILNGSVHVAPADSSYSLNLLDSTHDGLVDTVVFNYFAPGFSDYWVVEFSTSWLGTNLAPGFYDNATRYPFPSPGHPTMDVSGNGRGSNAVAGNFTVVSAQFDYSGAAPVATQLTIQFEHHSEGGAAAIFGTLVIDHGGMLVVDVVNEAPNEGNDTVESAVNYALPANVETLLLSGTGAIDGTGNELSNLVVGNGAANSLSGGAGDDTLEGDAGPDTLDGGEGNDFLAGGAGNDLLVSGEGNDILVGNAGDDTLDGQAGNDTINGGADNDFITGGAGDDSLVGGLGVDTVDYSGSSAGVLVDVGAGLASGAAIGVDTVQGVEVFVGGAGNDTLIAGGSFQAPSFDTLLGGDGDDRLSVGYGGGLLDGGAGDDTIFGGGDTLIGGDGDDKVEGAKDLMEGGAGNDTLTASSGIGALFGDDGNDLLIVDMGYHLLDGGAGDDTFAGTDIAGIQTLVGGAGWDFADFSSPWSIHLVVDLSTGTAQVPGRPVNHLSDIEAVRGGLYDDTISAGTNAADLSGNSGDDLLTGGAGNDTLHGDAGNDLLDGGDGDDTLEGNYGLDTLAGGAGDDSISGGPENDLYRYDSASFNSGDVTENGHDIIVATAGDLISMLGLNDNLQIGGTALSALTADAVIGSALSATTNIAFTGGVLQIDLDASGMFNAASDFQITLTGVNSVTYNATDDLFHLA
jgi:Ca2+-binding RTX toxin-like protein